jgi:hypothetical protein
MSEQPVESPQLYLVRIWPADPGFRASVRASDEQEPRWFTAAADLAAFLASTTSALPLCPAPPTGLYSGENDADPDTDPRSTP